MTTTIELDARGLQCPLPLLKLKQQLNRLLPGDCVFIQTTDAGSVRDFYAFAAQAKHIVQRSTEANGEYSFLIEKGQ